LVSGVHKNLGRDLTAEVTVYAGVIDEEVPGNVFRESQFL
jgi:hypothetical protein